MDITIRSRREGFRRCGIAHSVTPVTYPVEQFGASELDALRCEPMLVVDEPLVGDPSDAASEKPETKAGKTPAKTQKTTKAG